MNNNRFLWTGLAFSLMFSSGITVAASLSPTHGAKKLLSHEERVKIRKSEEKRIGQSQEKSYEKQMRALEKYYQKLASNVSLRKSQSDNSSLFSATKHFNQLSVEFSKQLSAELFKGFSAGVSNGLPQEFSTEFSTEIKNLIKQ